MVNWSTAVKKGIRWPVSHDCMAGWSVRLIEATCFFKSYPLISYWFNWSQAQVHKEKTIIINNLTWCPFGHYAIARSIHLGLSLRFPWNDHCRSVWTSKSIVLQNTPAVQTSMLASYLPGMFSNCHSNVTLFFVKGDVQEVLIVWVH